MNLSVYQSITVQQLRIGTVTNSSVLQIGTSGTIKALSHVYNTGSLENSAAQNGLEPEKRPPMVPLPEPTLKL
ncbi:spore germination protein GerPB [Paenibacillus sp. N3/727]|uniref:spore germination protein GerPB n=1 Tax=Paenibacillus sp. N3/727 TaxID=2925845 RepID=UPI001F53702D|nr:spore germination protein GerPB [Paenibacillus sp. N3/727]UNK20912.1 spore germination protein GerPB [Paenibacillus sp. N3/727]